MTNCYRLLTFFTQKAMSASERWKKKKAGVAEDPNEAKNKETMLRLTGLDDSILSRSGMMEVTLVPNPGICSSFATFITFLVSLLQFFKV